MSYRSGRLIFSVVAASLAMALLPLTASAQTGETTSATSVSSTTTSDPSTSVAQTTTVTTVVSGGPTTTSDVTTSSVPESSTSSTSTSSTSSTSTSTTSTSTTVVTSASQALLHWGLNETTGLVARDNASVSLAAISVGSTLGLPSYFPAAGTAVSGRVTGSRPSAIAAGGAVTMEFWSKGAGAGNWLGRVGHFGVYRGNRDYGRVQTVTLQFSSGVYASADLGSNGINIDLGAWHHYVVTHDGVNAGKLYIDGVLYLTGSAPWSALAGEVVVGESTGRVFDDVSVFGAALSPGQIRQRFAAGLATDPCPTAGAAAGYGQVLVSDGAVGVWRVGSGPVAVDSVGCRNGSFGDGVNYTPDSGVF